MIIKKSSLFSILRSLYFCKLCLLTSIVIASTMTSKLKNVPRLVAFDLDGTVWSPDMYQLWGGGSPFRVKDSSGQMLLDVSNTPVRLLGICGRLFADFKNEPIWNSTKFAWVSCTDEPDWAAECLSKFRTNNGDAIGTVVHASEIYKANKQTHFRNLKEKFQDISYSDMLFFDNEISNIRSVSKLGVKCVYCPDGVTQAAWDEGLAMFTTQEL